MKFHVVVANQLLSMDKSDSGFFLGLKHTLNEKKKFSAELD